MADIKLAQPTSIDAGTRARLGRPLSWKAVI